MSVNKIHCQHGRDWVVTHWPKLLLLSLTRTVTAMLISITKVEQRVADLHNGVHMGDVAALLYNAECENF